MMMHHPAFNVSGHCYISSGLFCLTLTLVARDVRARDSAVGQFISAMTLG
jgi:hypothetical protein